MTIGTTLRRLCIIAISTSLVSACSKASKKQNNGEDETRKIGESLVVEKTMVESRLFLTLHDSSSEKNSVTDDQVLSVLSSQCTSCHGPDNQARMDLSTLPSAAQSEDILKRIKLPISAPGHMPVGSAIPTDAKARLINWLENQINPRENGPFNDVKIEVRTKGDDSVISTGSENRGSGRYTLNIGKFAAGTSLSLEIRVAVGEKAPVNFNIEVASLPDDGNIYQTLSVKLADRNKIDGEETDGGSTDGTDIEPSPVAAVLDLQLLAHGTARVPDSKTLEILRINCQSCHNSGNTPRWDLTVIPQSNYLSEIALRINLDVQMIGHMPVGGKLAADDLGTLNRWLAEQKNPPEEMTGYVVRAVDIQTGNTLVSELIENGKTKIALGSHIPGTTLSLRITVTGPDGMSNENLLSVTVSEPGQEYADITLPERDTIAPSIPAKEIRVSDLTADSAKLNFSLADDNRPAEHLKYQAYRSKPNAAATFDTVDQVEANGIRIGEALTADQSLELKITNLDAATTYFLNVIVTDRTGNKSVYQKLEILTLPSVLCDEVAEAGSIQSWRNELARRLDEGSLSGTKATQEIRRCFKEKVPHCVSRTLNVAERNDIAPGGSDGNIDMVPQKRPPDEIRDLLAGPGKYWIPDNIEEIAKQKGWTSVRYKSRHAGGFDADTPNLLMVYVPGDKVDPPVSFDRWLNFPLPIDDDEPELGLPQHPRPKFGPPKREEYVPGNSFPSTFTMVSQERATPTKSATVYFQMFSRGNGASFSPRGPVQMSNCVSCHPNGLRAIAPLGYDLRAGEARLSDEDWKAVELINHKMVEGAGFKAATWGEGTVNGVKKPLYRAERGPMMGPAVPANGISRTKEFIMGGTLNGQQLQGCFKRRTTITIEDIFGRAPGMYEPHFKFKLSATPNINPEKVITAMSCEGCHAKGQRWPINEDTDLDQVRFKILVDQSMPKGLHQNPLDSGNDTGDVVDRLTADERIALVNCLEAEFDLEQEKQLEWMTQEQCQN